MHFQSAFAFAALPFITNALTYQASFTKYTGCNTKTTACGFYTKPGYSAAISQNVFGVAAGQGAGPGCRTCWKITGNYDPVSKRALSHPKTIVVEIDNECPAQGNPLCAMKTTSDANKYGGHVNFDLCVDSGAAAAFLDPSGVGLATGHATKVSCSEWSGTNHYGKVPRRGLGTFAAEDSPE